MIPIRILSGRAARTLTYFLNSQATITQAEIRSKRAIPLTRKVLNQVIVPLEGGEVSAVLVSRPCISFLLGKKFYTVTTDYEYLNKYIESEPNVILPLLE
jgi:hypothetical protein